MCVCVCWKSYAFQKEEDKNVSNGDEDNTYMQENESKDSQESLVHKTLGSEGTAIQLSTGCSASSSTHSVEGKKQSHNKLGGGEAGESQTGADTYIALVGVEDLLVATEKHTAYAA